MNLETGIERRLMWLGLIVCFSATAAVGAGGLVLAVGGGSPYRVLTAVGLTLVSVATLGLQACRFLDAGAADSGDHGGGEVS